MKHPFMSLGSGRNRSPLIRVPASRGLSTRVELRAVDPTANPYLALAVLLAAGLDGVEHKFGSARSNRIKYLRNDRRRT